jgi:hypothetical protein
MAAHIYDLSMRSLLMIAIYKFLNKKHDFQVLFWTLLNNTSTQKRVHVNFRGIIADYVSTDWSTVR